MPELAHEQEEAIVGLIVERATPRIRRDFHRIDHCIFATRVCVDVCRRFGLDAWALAVETLVANRCFAERITAGLLPLEDPEAWSVGVGFISQPRKRNEIGHLVCITPRFLVDLTIDQASRPGRGIVVEPMALPLEQHGRIDRGEILQATIGETVVCYRPRPKDREFGSSPDWSDPVRRARIVAYVVAEIEAELNIRTLS